MTGEELRDIRHTLGWTQDRLARELGYTSRYFAQCERGERPITVRMEKQALIIYHVSKLCALYGFHGASCQAPRPLDKRSVAP
jgi:transcriptional regulator with XRE-family HTH domain